MLEYMILLGPRLFFKLKATLATTTWTFVDNILFTFLMNYGLFIHFFDNIYKQLILYAWIINIKKEVTGEFIVDRPEGKTWNRIRTFFLSSPHFNICLYWEYIFQPSFGLRIIFRRQENRRNIPMTNIESLLVVYALYKGDAVTAKGTSPY